MSIDMGDVIFGIVSLALSAFVYLGVGAILGNLFGFVGFTWYFTMVAWPILLYVIWVGFAISVALLAAVFRVFK